MENIISYRDILGMDGKNGGVMPVGIIALQKLISTIADQRNQIKALEKANKKLIAKTIDQRITNENFSKIIYNQVEIIRKLESQTFSIRTITGIDLGDLG